MRMKLIIVVGLLFTFPTSASANGCATKIIQKTKANLASATAFRENVCKPHLSLLARHPVRKTWAKMSKVEQEQQIRYACEVFYSVASKLSNFDTEKIKWTGNVGRYGKKTIRVGFTGTCMATTACISDLPCIENTIRDFRKKL